MPTPSDLFRAPSIWQWPKLALLSALLAFAVNGTSAKAGFVLAGRDHPIWLGSMWPTANENALADARTRIDFLQRTKAALQQRQVAVRARIGTLGTSLFHNVAIEQRLSADLELAQANLLQEQNRHVRTQMQLAGTVRASQPTAREKAVMQGLHAVALTKLIAAEQNVDEIRSARQQVAAELIANNHIMRNLQQLHTRWSRHLGDLDREEHGWRLRVGELLRRVPPVQNKFEPVKTSLALPSKDTPQTFPSAHYRVLEDGEPPPHDVGFDTQATIAASLRPEAGQSIDRPIGQKSFDGRYFEEANPLLKRFMPVQGRLIDWARPAVEPPFDQGIRVETEHGQIVRANKNGQIVFAAPFRDLGPILIIDHGDEYHTVLAGLDRMVVKDGEMIEIGQILGMLPVSRQRKPRLYIEVRHRGAPIALLPWLAAREDKVRG